MHTNLRITLLAAAAAWAFGAGAEIPSGYYDKCENRGGQQLLSALCSTIATHTNVGYDGLWEVYKTSDVRADGTLWDIYSTKAWPSNFKQCGNYSVVGDCVNREHSFPKSWWGGGKQEQYSDAFHLYPTDGKVNGQRSNFPYGECSGGTQIPANGNVKPLGRLGSSTYPGYSGQVFEPDDQYKGDLARSYFYLAACYNGKISGWTSGNGGEMLAGNSYPVFKTWALEMLLKWHREDPVSQKEIDRNEAIYAHQKNRNPFIDHPEMVEYIWGEHKAESWASGADVQPKLTLPADGSKLDLGATIPGVARTATVAVAGNSLKDNVTITVAGSGFSVSPATLTAAQANAIDGAAVTVTFNPAAAGTYSGTLTVASGSLRSTVALSGSAVTDIPAGPVRAVGSESFTALWSYVGDADQNGNYTLDVRQGGSSIAGYPRSVKATDEYYTVINLQPLTTYTYTVASKTLKSQEVSVTTTEPVPAVVLLYDDDAVIYAVAGEESKAAEVLMFADYIDGDITLTVEAPFRLSADKSSWATKLVLSPDDERFYLDVLAEKPGNYTTTIDISAAGYHNDDVDFTAVVTDPGRPFYEDFDVEAGDNDHTYESHTYQGTMCLWQFDNAGIWNTEGRNDSQGVRMGKNSTSTLTMLDDTRAGLGVVTLWVKDWDGGATFQLEYSTDRGATWQAAGEGKAGSSTEWEQKTFTVNTERPTRLRVRQTAGRRFLLDDIEATVSAAVGEIETPDYHTWDAFCRDGRLTVEAAAETLVNVYALDGTVIFSGCVAPGLTAIDTAPGLYIVAVGDFGRRVVVR